MINLLHHACHINLAPHLLENALLVKRHDLIICGAAILAYEMRVIGAKEIHAADSDGMEGYFMHIAKSIL